MLLTQKSLLSVLALTLPLGSALTIRDICNEVNDVVKANVVNVKPAQVSQPLEAGALSGVINFRDITTGVKDNTPFSEITTSDGKKVRPGLVYRSNALDGATDHDLSLIAGAGIAQDFDFRLLVERAADIDKVPSSVNYVVDDVLGPCHGYAVEGSVLDQLGTDVKQTLASFSDGSFSVSDFGYGAMYKALAVYEGSLKAYHDVIHAIAYEDKPVVYHCTAGKDRTGVATAYILRILGVDLETILHSFLASNYYLKEADAVKQDYLENTWQVIDQVWGTFDAFVEKGLKLSNSDVTALQARLLE